MPKKVDLVHLTDEERDELYKALTMALQTGLLSVLGEYDDREDLCSTCVGWQVVRVLTVALAFFAKRVLPETQTLQEFLVEAVTQLDQSETVVH